MSEFLMHREIVCKIIGICLILVASIGGGTAYCCRIRLHLEQLRQLQQLMLLLQGEIQYQCETLPEAFIICGTQVKQICGDWMTETGRRLNEMEGMSFHSIWEEQLLKLQKKTALSASNIEDLRRLGSQLSYPDKETQVGALKLYCQRMKEQEGQFTRELPAKIRLGTTLGVLSGLFLIIVLM